MKKLITTVALLITLVGTSACGLVEEPTQTPVSSQTQTCEEDMPCWDCETMGNLKCSVNMDDAINTMMNGQPRDENTLKDFNETFEYSQVGEPVLGENLEAYESLTIPNVWYVFNLG